MRLLALAVLSMALPSAAPAQQTVSFSADGTAFTHPARIPQKVLALVMRDKVVFPKKAPDDLDCVRRERTTQPAKPQLLCTQLQVSPMPGVNYLILGAGSLYADHLAPFWIIHYEDDAATVLFNVRATSIHQLPERSQGYNEFQVDSITDGKPTSIRYRYVTGAYEPSPENPPSPAVKKP